MIEACFSRDRIPSQRCLIESKKKISRQFRLEELSQSQGYENREQNSTITWLSVIVTNFTKLRKRTSSYQDSWRIKKRLISSIQNLTQSALSNRQRTTPSIKSFVPETDATYKVISGGPCYILLIDKENLKAKVKIDFFTTDSNMKLFLQSSFIETYDSSMSTSNIWFITDFISARDQNRWVMTCARNHLHWKIEKFREYNAACSIYLNERIQWEWNLLQHAVLVLGIRWPIDFPADEILRRVNSAKMLLDKDIVRMMKNE